jgi:hypothetical protein
VTAMIRKSLAAERGQQHQQLAHQRPKSAQHWNCAACTLQNPMSQKLCRACSEPRQFGTEQEDVLLQRRFEQKFSIKFTCWLAYFWSYISAASERNPSAGASGSGPISRWGERIFLLCVGVGG